jgi:hypothetical protein
MLRVLFILARVAADVIIWGGLLFRSRSRPQAEVLFLRVPDPPEERSAAHF